MKRKFYMLILLLVFPSLSVLASNTSLMAARGGHEPESHGHTGHQNPHRGGEMHKGENYRHPNENRGFNRNLQQVNPVIEQNPVYVIPSDNSQDGS